MLRRYELLDELADDAELVEGVAALTELANDWRRRERTVRRRRAKLARLALKLRRERGELDGHRRRADRIFRGFTGRGIVKPAHTSALSRCGESRAL
jgi:hypothetical protein